MGNIKIMFKCTGHVIFFSILSHFSHEKYQIKNIVF